MKNLALLLPILILVLTNCTSNLDKDEKNKHVKDEMNSANEEDNSIGYEINTKDETIKVDNLGELKEIGFLDFIKKMEAGEDISDFEKETYYNEFVEKGNQGVQYLSVIHSTNDNLQVIRVRWSVSDIQNEEIWVYSNKGELKSSCEVPYKFEDFGIEIEDLKFELTNNSPIEVSIYIKWHEYHLSYDNEEGMPELGEQKETEDAKWILRVDDNFKCSFEELEIAH